MILKFGRKISFDEIKRVETFRNNLVLFTTSGKITEKGTTLKFFLPKLNFGRVQRGIILNFNNIEKALKTKI